MSVNELDYERWTPTRSSKCKLTKEVHVLQKNTLIRHIPGAVRNLTNFRCGLPTASVCSNED